MMSTVKSLRSVRTIRSISGSKFAFDNEVAFRETGGNPTTFEDLVPFVCRKFNCEYDIFVRKEFAKDELHRYKKTNTVPVKFKRNISVSQPTSIVVTPEISESVIACADDPSVVVISSLYDTRNRLVEVLIHKVRKVPRMLIQVIALVAPPFDHFNKLTIYKCNIDGAIIYELNKLVAVRSLTDICLDDTFLSEQNFSLFLEHSSSLRNLSLARCRIRDETCKDIVSKLHYQAPAERNLLLLNLSGNSITDVGAKYIATMLRSNRFLKYLNLASNEITDKGSVAILDVLTEFPLTYDEIADKRRRLLDYLKKKRALIAKYTKDLSEGSDTNLSVLSRKKKGMSFISREIVRTESFIEAKVDKLLEHVLEDIRDPFDITKTQSRDGWTYCIGNMTLCYLNLSYNDLSHLSVKKVLKVLLYQPQFKRLGTGLLKIRIEGNNLPSNCIEYSEISFLINKNLQDGIKELNLSKRRQTRASTISIRSVRKSLY